MKVWRHATTPRKKKFKIAPSEGKIKALVFGYDSGVILVIACLDGEEKTLAAMLKHQVGMLFLAVFDPYDKMSKLFFLIKMAGPHSNVHHSEPHKIRIHTVISPLTLTKQFRHCTIRFSPFLSFERQFARTSRGRRGTTEHRAAVESKFYLSEINGLVLGLKMASERWKVY